MVFYLYQQRSSVEEWGLITPRSVDLESRAAIHNRMTQLTELINVYSTVYQQRSSVEEWGAHNPQVRGSKRRAVINPLFGSCSTSELFGREKTKRRLAGGVKRHLVHVVFLRVEQQTDREFGLGEQQKRGRTKRHASTEKCTQTHVQHIKICM